MDKNTIAILQDNQTSIEVSFNKIDKKLSSASSADTSEKKSIINSIKQEIANVKASISLMKAELQNLHSEENMTTWEETISQIKSRVKSYSEKLTNLENEQKENLENVDPTDIDVQVDLNKMNVQQVMQRGENILDADDKAIENMGRVINQDVDVMKNVNVELNKQNEQLDNIDDDLKDIDYSLERAGKQIKNMFKLYSSDKCITCMIVVILLIIITIILVSALGGDSNKNFNVPHDIFNSNPKGNSTSFGGWIKVDYFALGIFYALGDL